MVMPMRCHGDYSTKVPVLRIIIITTNMRTIFQLIIMLAASISVATAQNSADSTSVTLRAKGANKTVFTVGVNGVYEFPFLFHESDRGRVASTIDYGVSFEARFNKHNGIEAGVYMRELKTKRLPDYSNPYTRIPDARYVSVAVFYKYYGRVLNYAAGINADFPTEKGSPDEYIFGLMFKLSKDIRIYKGLAVEPYVQGNYQFMNSEYQFGLVGVGVGLKYRFISK